MRGPLRASVFAFASLLVGCGGARNGETHHAAPRAEPSIATDAEAREGEGTTQESGGDEEPGFEELVASLGPPEWEVPPMRALADAIEPCTVDDCDLRGAIGFDSGAHRWIVFEVDSGEGGPESLRIRAVDASGSSTLHEGPVYPAAALRRAARALAPHRALPVPRNLVGDVATGEFSLNQYTIMAALEGPLEGWLITVESALSPREEEALVLIRRDGSERRELARRAASVGPCSGDGFYCESLDRECTLDELRAEGGACAEPMSVDRVCLADDRQLIVLGTRQVAGHGGYPPATWAVRLPDDIALATTP